MIHPPVDPECTRCRLSGSRKKVVGGAGRRPALLMLVGEAPGKDEDTAGFPFVGRAGRILDLALKEAGISRSDVYITNVVKCRPPRNRRPRADEIMACRRYLESEVTAVEPKVVCLLGATVAKTLLGEGRRMGHVAGMRRDLSLAGRTVAAFVAYHPAACLYKRELAQSLTETLRAAKEATSGAGGATQ